MITQSERTTRWPHERAWCPAGGTARATTPVKVAPDDALAQLISMMQGLTNEVAELKADRQVMARNVDRAREIANLAAAAGGRSALDNVPIQYFGNLAKHGVLFSDDMRARLDAVAEHQRASDLVLEKIAKRGDD